MNPKYPNLLSPTKIGNVELRNKTVMAAMGMSQAENGCETAELLGKQGKKVAIIEMTDKIAGNTGKTAQTVLLGHLKGHGVKLLTECRVEKITADEVLYKDKNDNACAIKADTVVLAIGNKPNTALYDSLKDEVKEIYNIGDSNGGGIIPNAVYDGYTVGNKI